MFARSTTIQAQPSSIDAGVAHVRDAVLPRIQEVDGCVGLSLLVDRESGRCIATTAWENEAALHASAQQVRPVRDEVAQKFGAAQRSTSGKSRYCIAITAPVRAPVCAPRGLGCGPSSSIGQSSSTGSQCCPRSKSSTALQREPDDRPCLVAGGVVVDVRQPRGDAAQ